MRTLLPKALLLALPFAAFFGWFEAARGSRSNNAILHKRQLLHAAATVADTRVLILGSSHEHDGILPRLVHSNAFNLALPSQSLYYDCTLVGRESRRLPALKLVILPISYFSPFTELERGSESWRSYYYTRFHRIPSLDYHRWLHVRNFSTWYLYGRQHPVDALRGTFPGDVTPLFDAAGGRTHADEQGLPPPPPDHVRTSGTNAVQRHHRQMSLGLLPEQRRRLLETVTRLRNQGLGVVLLQSPLSESYRAGRRPDFLAAHEALVAELLRIPGVGWRDYSADPRFDDADFADGDHLNRAGAGKFSRLLATEVVAPRLDAPR